jgi:DNA gyrase inhibitor GyrI
VILSILAWHGLFANISITEKKAGPYVLVYKKHIGNYKNSGNVMDEVYKDLISNSIESSKGFGLYYDNPRKVKTAKLRCVAGCIVDGVGIEELKKKISGYRIAEYPGSKCVIAEFPYRGKISINLGIFRVYPQLIDYLAYKKYDEMPIMELYDVPGHKIEYIVSPEIKTEFFDQLLN